MIARAFAPLLVVAAFAALGGACTDPATSKCKGKRKRQYQPLPKIRYPRQFPLPARCN